MHNYVIKNNKIIYFYLNFQCSHVTITHFSNSLYKIYILLCMHLILSGFNYFKEFYKILFGVMGLFYVLI